MNSWNDMRDSKSRFETKVRENLPSQLLDIDRDSCHYMHNIAMFYENIQKCFGKLFSDIHVDFFTTVTLVMYWLVFAISYP